MSTRTRCSIPSRRCRRGSRRIPRLMTTAFDSTGGSPGQVKFFLPGPVWVRRGVREAMAHEAIGHRGKAFADLYADIPSRLAQVFRTRGFVFTATSAATGLWEAALLNLAPERVLAIVSGAFSERWAQCSRDLGLAVDVLESPWGSPVDPDAVTAALKKARYDAVTVVHSETSTGTLNDLEAIARRRPGGLRGFRARRRRDLAGGLARRVRRLGRRLRAGRLAESPGAASGPGSRVRVRSATARVLASAHARTTCASRKPKRSPRSIRRPTRRRRPTSSLSTSSSTTSSRRRWRAAGRATTRCGGEWRRGRRSAATRSHRRPGRAPGPSRA